MHHIFFTHSSVDGHLDWPTNLVSYHNKNTTDWGWGKLKQQEFIFLELWRLEVQDQGIDRFDLSWHLSPWPAGGAFLHGLIASFHVNGNPLQNSGLDNPRDGGAWWAALCGVTQSRTLLKRLSSSSSSMVLPVCISGVSFVSKFPLFLRIPDGLD